MIDWTPSAVAIQIGPLPLYWYGIAYAVGLAGAYAMMVRQARRFGENPALIGNGLIVIAIAALIGGRLYHVVDQWQLYQGDLLKIVLPPYSGLGVFGGFVTGTLAFIWLTTRYYRVSTWRWADIVAPGLFVMQAVGRWGNFFNQELYGPPTDAPWGITIDCAHRIAQYACPPGSLPTDVPLQGFHPLFFYESSLTIIGGLIALYISRRFLSRLQPGDLAAFWGIWYGTVRFFLEFFREGWNWTVGGMPTAQIIGISLVAIGIAWIGYNHRPGAKPYEYLPAYVAPPEEESDLAMDPDPALDPDDEEAD